ncbi:hypothetical protein TK90_2692 (plasmid) [Thioalkalivibrio sp. K90mix]|uniref:hypothetical protein n=1 Tax=Thioalkalivibrio sp. (strain K90mix) TaxID=396595 RepID=UPI000195A445|nr:hypothetical protein [Thioalkalivibrio sp. K90mix]ADC73178.1 hypothetical protein TK90_2692 [Thioalkalivibrio sp. K90mix]
MTAHTGTITPRQMLLGVYKATSDAAPVEVRRIVTMNELEAADEDGGEAAMLELIERRAHEHAARGKTTSWPDPDSA